MKKNPFVFGRLPIPYIALRKAKPGDIFFSTSPQRNITGHFSIIGLKISTRNASLIVEDKMYHIVLIQVVGIADRAKWKIFLAKKSGRPRMSKNKKKKAKGAI